MIDICHTKNTCKQIKLCAILWAKTTKAMFIYIVGIKLTILPKATLLYLLRVALLHLNPSPTLSFHAVSWAVKFPTLYVFLHTAVETI